ncbi:MAG TPA: zf-HC2 domain-containing protein [Bryobacteraceae bacterium]|nr:zf-HC2 domain-containing protein [Bryobacteraceae bacterium]
MHGLIRDRLEEYLDGAPGRKFPLEIERHLQRCEECREEVSWMQEQSKLLRALSPAQEMDPSPGFYARVLNRIEKQQTTSVWSAFLDPVFGRSLSAAALAMVLLAFGFLAYSQPGNQPDVSAVEAMVSTDAQPPLGIDRDRDRETVFVTLATYRDE